MRLKGLTAALASIVLSACASSDPPPRAALTPRDFASHSTPPISPPLILAPTPVAPKPARGAPTQITGPVAASEGIMDVSASAGEPDLGAGDLPATPVTGELVDGVVGRVNNKAIYINEFLEPMGDHFRAAAKKLPSDQWLAFARQQISEALNRQLEDELLLAEARASFVTPEQRASLRAYLEAVQGSILSGAGGSRHRANQALLEKEGRTVDEELKYREQRDLIELELDRIKRRITVPFREIAHSYERQYDKFNPPPRAEFHLIRVAASNQEATAAVTQALGAGEDFAKVAARPGNEYLPDAGGAVSEAFSGDYATAEFFGLPALNDAAHSLTPGAHTGPIALGNYVWWLHLDRIDRTSMSLYDAQLSLELGLRTRLSEEARRKLLQRLKDRASFTSIDVMVKHLVNAAAERYYIPAGT